MRPHTPQLSAVRLCLCHRVAAGRVTAGSLDRMRASFIMSSGSRAAPSILTRRCSFKPFADAPEHAWSKTPPTHCSSQSPCSPSTKTPPETHPSRHHLFAPTQFIRHVSMPCGHCYACRQSSPQTYWRMADCETTISKPGDLVLERHGCGNRSSRCDISLRRHAGLSTRRTTI